MHVQLEKIVELNLTYCGTKPLIILQNRKRLCLSLRDSKVSQQSSLNKMLLELSVLLLIRIFSRNSEFSFVQLSFSKHNIQYKANKCHGTLLNYNF